MARNSNLTEKSIRLAKRAMELANQGLGRQQIADQLTAEGERTQFGGPYSLDGVTALLVIARKKGYGVNRRAQQRKSKTPPTPAQQALPAAAPPPSPPAPPAPAKPAPPMTSANGAAASRLKLAEDVFLSDLPDEAKLQVLGLLTKETKG